MIEHETEYPARLPEFAGSNPERQSVGLPGHCIRCATVGHVVAHPDLGCGDVGCNRSHEEETTLKTEAEIRAKIEELLTRIIDPRTKNSAVPLLYSQAAILHWALGEPFELVLA